MSNVVIGKKELLSFAERYSSQRVRDFSDLANGEVPLLLFSKIFPLFKIRPVSRHTHSISQRTQQNWETLLQCCVRVRIPLAFVQPVALAPDKENGFSLLALLYFLFHLSKRIDFSTEFGEDVPDALLTYLQSMDSIATLLLGEALDWSAVSDDIGEEIRSMPAFHSSPEEDLEAEERAIRDYRQSLMGNGKREKKLRRHTSFSAATFHTPAPSAPSVSFRTSSLGSTEGGAGNGRGARDDSALTGLLERESQLLQQLAVKTEECEALRCREVELLDQLSRSGPIKLSSEPLNLEKQRSPEMYQFLYEMERDRAAAIEAKLREAQTRLQELEATRDSLEWNAAVNPLEVEVLLEDLRDPETNERMEAHVIANHLHQYIHTGSTSEPRKREGLNLLRQLWAAYSELEKRLVRSVEIIDSCSALTPRRGAAVERSHVEYSERFPNDVRQAVEEVRKALDAFSTLTWRREEQWRSLCSKLYQVEKITFQTAQLVEEGGQTKELQATKASREQHYQDIESLTEGLLGLPRTGTGDVSNIRSTQGLHDAMSDLEKKVEHLQVLVDRFN